MHYVFSSPLEIKPYKHSTPSNLNQYQQQQKQNKTTTNADCNNTRTMQLLQYVTSHAQSPQFGKSTGKLHKQPTSKFSHYNKKLFFFLKYTHCNNTRTVQLFENVTSHSGSFSSPQFGKTAKGDSSTDCILDVYM